MAAGGWLATGDLVRPGAGGALCFYARRSSLIASPHGSTTLDEIEEAATKALPDTTAVAVAEGDRSVSLFLFTGDDVAEPESPGAILRAFQDGEVPQLRCVQRVAVIPGLPSLLRHEIGPTGKARRWMIHEHWEDHLHDREDGRRSDHREGESAHASR